MKTSVIPQYKDRAKLSGTSIRLTKQQLDELNRLMDATNKRGLHSSRGAEVLYLLIQSERRVQRVGGGASVLL